MTIINYVVVGSNRIELPKSWYEIATELELSEREKMLLSMHFDGYSTLESELYMYSKDLTTQWYKLEHSKYSSIVRLYHGSLEYKTYKGDTVKPHIKQRSHNDNHKNVYLCYSNGEYLHRLKAKIVYRTIGASMNFRGLVVHHRLTDKTSTIQGNSLDNLVVMNELDHAALHKALDKIVNYIQTGIVQLHLPLSI